MKTSWVVALFTLFILFTMISGVIEQNYVGANEVTVLNRLMSPQIPESHNAIGTVYSIITVVWNWLQAFWDALWFNYAFFQGWWLIVKFAIFIPISLGMIWGLLSMLRGFSSGF